MENRIVQLIENLNILTKSIFYFLAFLFILTTYTFANSPEVTAVRIGGDENKTRFVLEINNDITFRTLSLANPNRVVIDLDEVIWKIGPGGAAGQGLINNYRYGLYLSGTSRIVAFVLLHWRIMSMNSTDMPGVFSNCSFAISSRSSFTHWLR